MSHTRIEPFIPFLHAVKMVRVASLPDRFCNADLLQVCADRGLIEFGQQHDETTCSAGEYIPVKRWRWYSKSGPGYKPIAEFLQELERDHCVRLTTHGHTEASQLKLEKTFDVAELSERIEDLFIIAHNIADYVRETIKRDPDDMSRWKALAIDAASLRDGFNAVFPSEWDKHKDDLLGTAAGGSGHYDGLKYVGRIVEVFELMAGDEPVTFDAEQFHQSCGSQIWASLPDIPCEPGIDNRIEVERAKLQKQNAGDLSPDGPIGGGFRWNGQDHYGLNGKAERLVGYLWDATQKTATFDDLAGPVWGDHAKVITVNMVGKARTRANKFFLNNTIPFEVSIADRSVKLFPTK